MEMGQKFCQRGRDIEHIDITENAERGLKTIKSVKARKMAKLFLNLPYEVGQKNSFFIWGGLKNFGQLWEGA